MTDTMEALEERNILMIEKLLLRSFGAKNILVYARAINIWPLSGQFDYEKATQAAIQGMLYTLDPHSVYFPAVEFKKLKEDQSSSFYGIGVQIQRHDDGVYVTSVVDGTPASRSGLRCGDRILEVDGKDAPDWSSEEVSKNVRGDRLKPVQVKVERDGEEVATNVKLTRDAAPLPSSPN